jgi:ATP-dependent RNA helicase MSS116
MPDALELHSRLSQGQRNAVTQAFAKGKGLVLFASDVIARGIDFPDVTLVVQLGLTDVSQYEHRIGRTGRAGKSGEALIILGDDAESRLLGDLLKAGMQIVARAPPSAEALAPAPALAMAMARLGTPGSELNRTACRAFTASLGFYNSHMKRLGWKPVDMVAAVVARFKAAGLREVPPVSRMTLDKMHLRGVPGIVEASQTPRPPRGTAHRR